MKMDGLSSKPQEDATVISSSDFDTASSKTDNFKASVSVLSLTEKFEKSGDFGSVIENNTNCGCNGAASQTFIEAKDLNPGLKVENNAISAIYVSSNEESSTESGKDNLQSSNVSTDIDVQKANKTTCDSSKLPSLPSALKEGKDSQSCSEDNRVLVTEAEINKVEERVAYFIKNRMSLLHDSASKSDMNDKKETSICSSENKYIEMLKLTPVVNMEKAFIDALKQVDCHAIGAEKSSVTLPVPSIQITEASDREDSSSDGADVMTSESEIKATEVKKIEKSTVSKMEECTAKENIDETLPSSCASDNEKSAKSELGQKERRPFFYLSSSELETKESSRNSGEFSQQSMNEERTNPVLVTSNENASSFCLCSKGVHGVIFLTSFIIAIAGFILYNMAHERKVPDFCEHLGLVTAILAGIVGAFSCFCYSILEVFPGIPAKYERLRETRNIERKVKAGNLDEESWSSEKEQAFRRQNAMTSKRTTAASIENEENGFLLIRKSDKQELVDKAEKLKKDAITLVDMLKSWPKETDELRKLESGMVNGY